MRLEKYYTADTFNVYCQFPLLKSFLWHKGNVNLHSDPHSYCTCISFSTEICKKFWTWTALSQTGCNRSWTSTAPSHEWNVLLIVHVLLLSWKVLGLYSGLRRRYVWVKKEKFTKFWCKKHGQKTLLRTLRHRQKECYTFSKCSTFFWAIF